MIVSSDSCCVDCQPSAGLQFFDLPTHLISAGSIACCAGISQHHPYVPHKNHVILTSNSRDAFQGIGKDPKLSIVLDLLDLHIIFIY